MYPKFADKTLIEEFPLSSILRYRGTFLTIWSDFNRRAKRILNERYICVMKGQETFKLVSPIYRKNLYVGVFIWADKQNSPLDFFNINEKKYPLTKQVNFIDAKLEEGDCMYVPAFYFVQSKSTGSGDSIVFT